MISMIISVGVPCSGSHATLIDRSPGNRNRSIIILCCTDVQTGLAWSSCRFLVVGVMVLVDQRSCSSTAVDGVVGLLSSILSVFTMSLKVDSYTLLRP